MVGGDPDSRVFQEWIKAYCSIFGENVHPFACHFDVHQGMRVPIAIAPPPQWGTKPGLGRGCQRIFRWLRSYCDAHLGNMCWETLRVALFDELGLGRL